MGCLEFMHAPMEGFTLDAFALTAPIRDKIPVLRGGPSSEGDPDLGKREGESVDWGDPEVAVEPPYPRPICRACYWS